KIKILPLVSVYITTKNRPVFLERALKSVVNQTYKKIEILICNDGSDDCYDKDYNAVINKYTTLFQNINIEYRKNIESLGACESRNLLIENARGVFITGLDDDDYFFPDRIKLFVENYDDKYAFLCANGSLNNDCLNKKTIDGGKVITFEEMKNYNLIGNQIFIRRERLIDIGGFDKNMPAWQDYDTWFRLLKKYYCCYKLNARTMYIDTDLSRHRISTTSKAYLGYQAFIRKHSSDLNAYNLLSLKYNDLINRKEKFSILKFELLRKPFLF
ncbi:TPA: glycosyltransferase, partial [Escherichia coli]|nr:glycosyltransferase [Escherichia coli]